MSNKTQLHLNTVDFRETLAGTARRSCKSLIKPKRCITESRASSAHPDKRQMKTHSLNKKHSAQITPSPPGSNNDFMARFSELSINRQSMRDFTKKQFFKQKGSFPKRDSILRNTNAFKYFVQSTINKPVHTDHTFLEDFYNKIRQAAAEQTKKEIVDNQSRRKAITECSLTPYRPSRIKRLKTSKNPQFPTGKDGRAMAGGGLQPWQTAQENSLYLTDL